MAENRALRHARGSGKAFSRLPRNTIGWQSECSLRCRGKRAEVGHSEPARILLRWCVPLGVTLQRHDGPSQSSSAAPWPSPVR